MISQAGLYSSDGNLIRTVELEQTSPTMWSLSEPLRADKGQTIVVHIETEHGTFDHALGEFEIRNLTGSWRPRSSHDRTTSRWAAFTDHELHDLWQILVAYPSGGPIHTDIANAFTDEVEAEIARRRA